MDTVTLLYSLSGLLIGAAFVPQVVTLLKDKSGAASTSLMSAFMFTACSVVTLLYARERAGDVYFFFCSVIGVVGNISVFMLVLFRRIQPKLAFQHYSRAAR